MKSTIQLTYFKESGKYYSEGSYVTEKELVYDIIDEIKKMPNLPGVLFSYSTTDLGYIVGSYNHPHFGHPFLINMKTGRSKEI